METQCTKKPMLKLLILVGFVAFTLMPKSMQAQEDESEFRVFGEITMNPFKTRGNQITLAYVDESPSRDNLYSVTQLKQTPFSPGIRFGVEYELPMNVFFKGAVGGYFGHVKGLSFDFGVGYSLGDKIKFRPQLIFAYASSRIKLGDVIQNDLFIQVNSQKFYSDLVSVKLANSVFMVRPKIDIAIPVKSSFEVRIGVGYNLVMTKSSPNLRFSGEDLEGETVTEAESILVSNVNIKHDGKTIGKSIIKYNLPFVNLGFAYSF